MKSSFVLIIVVFCVIKTVNAQHDTANKLLPMDYLCHGKWKADNGKCFVELTFRWGESKRIIYSTLRFIDYGNHETGFHDGFYSYDASADKIILADVDKKTGAWQKGIAWFEGNELHDNIYLPGQTEKYYSAKFIFQDQRKMLLVWLTNPDGSKSNEPPVEYINEE